MNLKWADELPGSEPDAKLEDFYLLVALKLGDPSRRDWLLEHSEEFYAMYQDWGQYDPYAKQDNATVMVQYLLWYERDGPKVDTHQ